MENVTLTDLIDASILQKIQDAFAKYTNMAALITDADGVPVTKGSNFSRFCTELVRKSELGCKKCEACDREGAVATWKSGRPTVYKCHAGLIDYAAPIMLQGRVIGSFIGGQVRVSEIDEEQMRAIARKYSIDEEEYIKASRETSIISMNDIERAAQFLAEMSETLSDMAYKNYLALSQSKRLERAARSQTNFIMSLSTEVHQSISRWTDNIKNVFESDDTDKIREIMKKLMIQSKELGAAVSSTVDYMHMVGGDFELSENIYSIKDLADKSVSAFENAVREKGNTINIDIDKNMPARLCGDSGRIAQVLNKLIENAVRFTWNGQINVKVACRKGLYADMLIIKVKDNGVGLSPEDLENVRLYLCDSIDSATKNNDVLVPGFSIIGFLVRQLGGTINVNSKMGEGTEFSVQFPQLTVTGEINDEIKS